MPHRHKSRINVAGNSISDPQCRWSQAKNEGGVIIERQNYNNGTDILFRITPDLYCNNALSENMVGFIVVNHDCRRHNRRYKNLFMANQKSLVKPTFC